jgi:hypothetical protein
MSDSITRWDNGELGGKRIAINKSKKRFVYYVKNRYGTARYELKGHSPAELKAWRLRILSGISEKPFAACYVSDEEE